MNDKVSKDVWVFVEQRDGKAAEVSLELLCKGRKLADQLGGELKAVVIAANALELAERTFRYGADEALVVSHPSLQHFRTVPYSRVLIELVKEHQPRIVLYGATVIGRDIAPRIASATGSGLTADCTDLQIADVTYLKQEHHQLLLQIRPAFGGNIIATIITPDARVQMATVREGVMELTPLSTPNPSRLVQVPFAPQPVDDLVEIIERHREESRVNLKGANIIVSGGYGMGSRENFQLIHELAHVLGGEVAGSRAAVDAGFVPRERQVGQTGTTVRPKLYIACGISGAIQHRAGMQESNKIVAINSDPDAPIFDIAHYGIFGDAVEVIPKLIEVYKQRLK
ncbi:MAG TPA: electron transfer flavoprotein subunit alpha/FixB family protein [Polyangiaceae bacterium]|nr:electron transfer flavoprotein subunit alpha/FixB family protein [Polyangiaceae bacterium]